jgi:hypothetical protein
VVTELYLLLFRKVGEFKSERGGKAEKSVKKVDFGKFWFIMSWLEWG